MGGVLSDLVSMGYEVRSVSELRTSGVRYHSAVPILLKWLPRAGSSTEKEELVRALSVPWAREEALTPLIEEFRAVPLSGESDEDLLRWTIGSGIEVLWDDVRFDELVELARDDRFGKAREMVVFGLGRSKRPEAADILIALLDDPTVSGHAVKALGKLRVPRARHGLEQMTSDRRAWVRKEAEKALAHGKPVPVATVRYAYYVAQAVFKHARKNDYIAADPCASVQFPTTPPDAPKVVEGRFLARDEVERLATALEKEELVYGLLVRFAVTTGLRQSEMAGLRLGDVHLERRTIRVARTVHKRSDGTWVEGEPKTKNSKRHVPILDDDVADELTAHIAEHPRRTQPDAPLFPAVGRQGLHYDEPWDAKTWYRRHFRPALRAAGLPNKPRDGVRWHDLRHTAGSQWIADGFPLETVSDWLGHGSINFTHRVYVHAPRVPDYSAAIERARVAKVAWKESVASTAGWL